jgi:hypothetical protein
LPSISSVQLAFSGRSRRNFEGKHVYRFWLFNIINIKYIFLSYDLFLGYEKTMRNLGILYNIFPTSYKVSLLSAVAHEGNIEHFRKYGFILTKDDLDYGRRRQKKGDIIPYELSEKKEKIINNKRNYYEKVKLEIIQFLERNCEKSSIPLLEAGFFSLFLCIF